jgi:hypothetical protein
MTFAEKDATREGSVDSRHLMPRHSNTHPRQPGLATHEEAGGVFGALLTAAALIARACLRFFALFLARAFTSLTRLCCPAAFR